MHLWPPPCQCVPLEMHHVLISKHEGAPDLLDKDLAATCKPVLVVLVMTFLMHALAALLCTLQLPCCARYACPAEHAVGALLCSCD